MNIPRAMLWVAMGDLIISLLAGLAIFACIGFMSHVQGVPFTSVVTSSVFGLGFVVFPKILQQFHPFVSMFVGPLFFFSLFIAGITGVFSIFESIAGNFEVEFNLTRSRAITITTGLVFFCSLIFCFGNATHIMDALEPMIGGFNMLISGFAQILVFMYLSSTIMGHSAWFTANKKRTFGYYSLKFVVPFILLAIFVSSTYAEIKSGFGAPEIVRWGWLAAALVGAYLLSGHSEKKLLDS